MNLNDIHKVYFVGIGGIGMSALARYFNGRGVDVHGYDKTRTSLTDQLQSEGMTIHYEDDTRYIPSMIDLVVYTPAIPHTHKELTYLKTNGFKVKKRSEVLGIISRGMKCIAIAGTHGKKTTSSITTHVLRTAGIDCSAFLGGIARNYDSNFVEGKGEWVVVEADEFDRSFLQLNPDIAVVMAMDADHLDIYGTVEEMHRGFSNFVHNTKPEGHVFVKDKLPLHIEGSFLADRIVRTFGVAGGRFRAEQIRVENGFFVFDFKSPLGDIDNLKFTLPGRHNIENAAAAIGITQLLGGKGKDIRKALSTFKGIQRRFDFVTRTKNCVYIDDYAHHPTELNAAIRAARDLFPDKRITGIFQPHLYSRTRDFVDGFADALDRLDEVILMPIYPARELPIEGVTSEIIFDKMKNPNKQIVAKKDLLEVLKSKQVEVLLTLGAGDIDIFVEPIKTWLTDKAELMVND